MELNRSKFKPNKACGKIYGCVCGVGGDIVFYLKTNTGHKLNLSLIDFRVFFMTVRARLIICIICNFQISLLPK